MLKLVSLFASLLAIPLACQCCLHAALLTGLQIVGVTLYFLDNVLLLYLPLEPAQRIFERLAFLYANLCQEIPPPNPPNGLLYDTVTGDFPVKESLSIFFDDIYIAHFPAPFSFLFGNAGTVSEIPGGGMASTGGALLLSGPHARKMP
jgi:hypothetical protein